MYLYNWNVHFPATIPETIAKMVECVSSGDIYWQQRRQRRDITLSAVVRRQQIMRTLNSLWVSDRLEGKADHQGR